MAACFQVYGTFIDLELPSSTFPLPFVYVVTILLVHLPLVVLPTKVLVDHVSLIVPCDGVGEVVLGVLIPLVNLPLLSLCLFIHSTYHDFKLLKIYLL